MLDYEHFSKIKSQIVLSDAGELIISESRMCRFF